VSEPLLAVEGLNAFYSNAHVLRDVSFSMENESVAVIGRNGMGKSTLCAALMGFSPPRTSGSVRFGGLELMGKPSYKIARSGLGYVPQGRRLFPSLTVHEHLRIAARGGGILSTVRATRAASIDDLVESGKRRLNRMLLHGTTTCSAAGSGLTLPAGSYYRVQSTSQGGTSGRIGVSFEMVDP